MFLLTGGRGFTRREGLRRLKERLQNVAGVTSVRYRPTKIRPRTVVADIAVEQFLGESFPRPEAKLETLWRPQEGRDCQRVQYADTTVSLGWHKDDDHPELGTTHYQLETDNEVRYEPANIEAEAPLSFLEICLDRLRKRLQEDVNG